jgi:steroid delta-isomerase-like uncharacterized protein
MEHVKVLSLCLIAVVLVCTGCKPSETAGLEENKALVLRALENPSTGNWTEFKALHTSDFLYHSPIGSEPMKLEEFMEFTRDLYTNFPDWHGTIEDVIAEGGKVVVRGIFQGTNKGDIEELGIIATGKEVTLPVIFIFRIADGKIAELWQEYNMMSFVQQLRDMPTERM